MKKIMGFIQRPLPGGTFNFICSQCFQTVDSLASNDANAPPNTHMCKRQKQANTFVVEERGEYISSLRVLPRTH
jgi:hypothetical protein